MPFFRGYDNNRSPLPLPELEGRHRADCILGGGIAAIFLIGILWIKGPTWTWDALTTALHSLWSGIVAWTHPITTLDAQGFSASTWHFLRITGVVHATAPHVPVPSTPPPVSAKTPPAPVPVSGTPPHWWRDLTRIILMGSGAGCLGLVGGLISRALTRWHRLRWMTWHEIQFFQHDETTPAVLTDILDAIYAATRVRSRWLNTAAIYRWLLGEPPWSLQVLRRSDHPTAPQGIHFVLAAPGPIALRSIESALRTTYTNLRFLPWENPPQAPMAFMARWSIRRRGALQLMHLSPRYEALPLETLVQSLAHDTFPEGVWPDFCFQWILIPVPTQRAQRRLQTRVNYAQWENYAMDQAAVPNALSQVGHGRWRTEWRLSADSWETLQKVAGAWGTDNHHAELRMRLIIIWRWLFYRWMSTALPGLWPIARPIALWSGELATFMALPTGRLRVVDLNRSMTRRMPASQRFPRTMAQALMIAEPQDWVGLDEADRSKNVLIRGTQGTGKSQVLLRLFQSDLLASASVRSIDSWRTDPTVADAVFRDPLKAVVLIDIGKDTAQRALSLVPPGRSVLWVDPSDPTNPWQIQPFREDNHRATRTAQILELLVNEFSDDSIQDRSKYFLRMFILTALEAEPRAGFGTVYTMMINGAYRDALQQECTDPVLRAFWDHDFPQQMATNPRFLDEALMAPRNKLSALIYHPAARQILGGRLPDEPPPDRAQHVRIINWDRVIREHQVVICNFQKSQLGDENARLLGIATILGLWNALERQGQRDEAERNVCSLLIDEAQNFVSKNFADMLAEGRAYGLQVALAVRFLGEIGDVRAQAAIEELCHNLITFRVHSDKEAVTLTHLIQRLYINNVTLAEDVQALTNFAVDDLLHLPDHHAICFWQFHGTLEPAFAAQSIPWQPLDADAAWIAERKAWATYHVAEQRTISQSYPDDAEDAPRLSTRPVPVMNPTEAPEPDDSPAFDPESELSAEIHDEGAPGDIQSGFDETVQDGENPPDASATEPIEVSVSPKPRRPRKRTAKGPSASSIKQPTFWSSDTDDAEAIDTEPSPTPPSDHSDRATAIVSAAPASETPAEDRGHPEDAPMPGDDVEDHADVLWTTEQWSQALAAHGWPARLAPTIQRWALQHTWTPDAILEALATCPESAWTSPLGWREWADSTWDAPLAPLKVSPPLS